jgi:hypothetical protein
VAGEGNNPSRKQLSMTQSIIERLNSFLKSGVRSVKTQATQREFRGGRQRKSTRLHGHVRCACLIANPVGKDTCDHTVTVNGKVGAAGNANRFCKKHRRYVCRLCGKRDR